MTNLSVDKDKNHIHQMWRTIEHATDCGSLSEKKKVIQEIMHDDIEKNKFSLTESVHKIIRNDNDYDDWEYGTEPSYGHPWK